MQNQLKRILILGTRGIPAKHGGFETFAENLAIYLKDRNWRTSVYCQVDGKGKIIYSSWKNIELINIPVSQSGALGTVIFDLKATLHSLTQKGLPLVLGYNTAVFGVLYRLLGRKHVINMDGIEWKRAKWGTLAKAWFYFNERCGCWLGNHLIADHPEIARHLSTRVSANKITMIPYGANEVDDSDTSILQALQLNPKQYSLVVARAEPENSILEIVSAFSRVSRGMHKLVVLGSYNPSSNSYHKKVMDAANSQVIFPGAIYEKKMVASLRINCAIYFHGHTVGGTNPALVEAMGAGCAIAAHDNLFNRWVAGQSAAYFQDEAHCAELMDTYLHNTAMLDTMRLASKNQFLVNFTWEKILDKYETLLSAWQ